MKNFKKILIFVLCAFAVFCTVGFSNVKAMTGTPVKYDFVNNSDFAKWGSSYTSHTISFSNVTPAATFNFEKANKQSAGASIDNMPVTKGFNFSMTLDKAAYKIDYLKITFKQWGTKTQTANVTLGKVTKSFNTFANGYLIAELDNIAEADSANGFTVSFANQSNQIGIASVELTIAKVEEHSYNNFVSQSTKTSLNIDYTTIMPEGELSHYEEVTTAQTDWSGTYIITYKDTTNNELIVLNPAKGDSSKNFETMALSSGNIASNEILDSCAIVITKGTAQDEYHISYGDKYISNDTKSNKLNFTNEKKSVFITFNGTDVKIKGNNAKATYLAYANGIYNGQLTDSNRRFRFYGSVQQEITLFKYVAGAEKTYEVAKTDLRFGTMVPVADYDAMVAEGATFGVALKKGAAGTEKFFVCTPVRVNAQGLEDAAGEYYQFAVVLTNIPLTDYAVEVTGKCYVEIAGVKHFMIEKTASVKTTAQAYLDATDTSAYKDHLGVLGLLAK